MCVLVRFPQDVAKKLNLNNGGDAVSCVELASRLTLYAGHAIDPTNAATALRVAMIAQNAARGFIKNAPGWREIAYTAMLLALFDTPEQISREDADVWIFCLLYHYFMRKVLVEGETYKEISEVDAYGFGKMLSGKEIVNIANLPDMLVANGKSECVPVLASIALEWFIYIRKLEAVVPEKKETKALVEVLITENEIGLEETHE